MIKLRKEFQKCLSRWGVGSIRMCTGLSMMSVDK